MTPSRGLTGYSVMNAGRVWTTVSVMRIKSPALPFYTYDTAKRGIGL